jgi:hypothetical protein
MCPGIAVTVGTPTFDGSGGGNSDLWFDEAEM